jgi:hypothetical protein
MSLTCASEGGCEHRISRILNASDNSTARVGLALADDVHLDDFDMSTCLRLPLDDIKNLPLETCWGARAYEPKIKFAEVS